MCDPFTIGGAVLMVASAAANASAARQVARARNEALTAEMIRQRKLDSEAEALNEQARNRYTEFQDKQREAENKLADYFVGQEMPAPPDEASLPTTSSNVVVQEEAKQRGKAKDFTTRTGTALGQLRAFGDTLGDISRLQGRDAAQIGTIGGFKQASQGILPLELDAAMQKGQGARTMADLFGGAGSLALGYGLMGPATQPATIFNGAGGLSVTGAAPKVGFTGAGGLGLRAPANGPRLSMLFG